MPNKLYDNFFLANEVEDQFESHLDLMQFCTVDRSLEGTAGMKHIVNIYSATNGTEKLAMGQGNSKDIEVDFTQKEYEILLAQNRFTYHDEEEMKDPKAVLVGMKHAGTDLFNTVNADIFTAFQSATLSTAPTAFNFDAFVDAQAELNTEEEDSTFAFVCPKDMANIRKALKDSLQYVEAFARNGYVGTVGGTNLYKKKNAVEGEIILGTKEAVTCFIKKGTEIEDDRDGDTRTNRIFTRKYYVCALTNPAKAVKMALAG